MFDTDVKECGLISSHRLSATEMRTRRPRGHTVGFPYRDLKKVDNAIVEERLRRSSLLSPSAPTAEVFTNQFAEIVFDELNKLAPARFYTRRQSKLSRNGYQKKPSKLSVNVVD